MRKILMILFASFFVLGLNAQSVVVNGTVTNTDGTPAPDVEILIEVPSNNPGTPGYTSSLLTDLTGFYSDTIPITPNQSQGILFVSMIDCNGNVQVQTLSWFPGNFELIADFVYCSNIVGNNCDVTIELDSTVFGGLTLIANATGTAPFTYEWNTGETTQSIPYTPNGLVFCVTVTDADGCVAEDCFFGWPGNCAVTISADSTGAGGLILIANATGTAPFTYQWDNGETTPSITPDPNTIEHCVVVTDASGCVATACYQFGNNADCGVWLTYDCPWGSIPTLTAHAWGAQPYSYLWSTGETTETINPTDSGEYCVTITDANDCVAESCMWIDIITVDSCSVNISVVQNGGWLYADAWGNLPITYLWNTGETAPDVQIDPTINEYCVTITDNTGCEATDCYDLATGCDVSIEITPATAGLYAYPTGIPPFTFEWNTGESDQVIHPSDPGEYCVTLTDAVGCTSEDCFMWDDSTGFCFVDILVDSIPGALGYELTAVGSGTGPLEYFWDTPNQPAGPTIFVSQSGTYCVTMFDGANCVATNCVTIDLGSGGCSVEIVEFADSSNITVLWAETTGAGNFLYEWSTGETEPVIFPTSSGVYCVTVTSPDGCVAEDCADVNLSTIGVVDGWVYDPNGNQLNGVFGNAILYKLDPNTGSPDEVAQTPIIPFPFGQRYMFTNVDDGNYLVRVVLDPSSPGFDDYLPTYYGDTEFWDEATVITLPVNANQSYDIYLVDADGLNGPGDISGLVVEGDGLVGGNDDRNEGDPVENVSVLLYDENEFPVGFQFTDEDGEFKFENLAWGTYKVLLEITGKEQSWYWVTIGPDNPSAGDLVFEVNENETTTGIEEVFVNETIQIFPNPTSGDLNMVFELKDNLETQIILTDVTGKTVFAEKQSLFNGKHQLNLNIGHLPNGVFFLNITTGKDVISHRIIKH